MEVNAAPAALELNATGRVILGMIALGKRTGYDIKQLVDKSTRHFWAASYGQIYPELRKLEQQGLVRGTSEPSGGRARTVYELTKSGRDALEGWLGTAQQPVFEVRDEGMLKLFFSDLGPGRQAEIVAEIREHHQRKLEQLRGIQSQMEIERLGPALTLEAGIGFTQWWIEWCEETERRLAGDESER